MPKTILLVDADAALRGELEGALTQRGYQVQENADGKDVVEQVRSGQPALVILSVELPKGSGYAICSKLRKDEALKQIPVILTSSEATQKAFDDHKKLKLGRADEYLLKPFAADTLMEKVAALLGDEAGEGSGALDSLGLSDLAHEFGDTSGAANGLGSSEERVAIEDIEEISVEDDLAPSPASLPGARDVDLLENAFDRLEDHETTGIHDLTAGLNGLGEHHDASTDAGSVVSEAEFAPESEALAGDSVLAEDPPEEIVELTVRRPPRNPPERAAGADPPPIPDEPARPMAPASGRDRDYFQVKERLAQREKELLRLREEVNEKEKELLEQRDHETQLEQELSGKDDEIAKRDALTKQLQQKIDALVAGQRRTEKDSTAAREEAKAATQKALAAEQARGSAEQQAREKTEAADQLEQDLALARERLAERESESESQHARNDEIDAELTGVRAQLDEANSALEDVRRQLEQHRADADAAQEDLRRRLSDTEDEKQKHEERVVKAYQRLKGEEKVREKARKALGIALQLLDDQANEPLESEEEQRT